MRPLVSFYTCIVRYAMRVIYFGRISRRSEKTTVSHIETKGECNRTSVNFFNASIIFVQITLHPAPSKTTFRNVAQLGPSPGMG